MGLKRSFDEDGVAGPCRALAPADAERARARVLGSVVGPNAGLVGDAVHCRHLDDRFTFDLCTTPAVLDRVGELLGPDVVLWRSNYWCKRPGGPEVPWHQDHSYWPIHPLVNVTAWMALDDATVDNGCLEVVPGTHRAELPTEPLTGDPLSDRVLDAAVPASGAVQLEVRAGEFVLMAAMLLHRSLPNRSQRTRLALASRFTTPHVRVDSSKLLGGRHRNLLVAGSVAPSTENRYGAAPAST